MCKRWPTIHHDTRIQVSHAEANENRILRCGIPPPSRKALITAIRTSVLVELRKETCATHLTEPINTSTKTATSNYPIQQIRRIDDPIENHFQCQSQIFLISFGASGVRYRRRQFLPIITDENCTRRAMIPIEVGFGWCRLCDRSRLLEGPPIFHFSLSSAVECGAIAFAASDGLSGWMNRAKREDEADVVSWRGVWRLPLLLLPLIMRGKWMEINLKQTVGIGVYS